MNKLVLLDSNSLVNRAFYALPPLSDSKGRYTNAIYGFLSMLIKIIDELKPTHIAAAFDLPAPTFRHERYEGYKAGRKPMPEELAMQIPLLKELLRAMDITIAEVAGYEADDVIGTLARKTPFDTVIVSGDRDTLQLVGDTTRVWYTRKGLSNVEELDLISLKEKGFTPEMIVDLKSLMGDSSDNIPGVMGVGEKTAMSLLNDYGSLDGVYEHIEEIKGALKNKLIDNKETAYLSHELATINDEVPIDTASEKYSFKYPFKPIVKEMLSELGIRALLSRLTFDESIEQVETEGEVVKVTELTVLPTLSSKIKAAGKLAIAIGSEIHLAYDDKTEYILTPADDLINNFSYDSILEGLKSVLIDPAVGIIAFDYKSLKHKLNGGISGLRQDIMLKSYVANAGMGYSSLKDLTDACGMCGDKIAIQLIKLDAELEKKLIDDKTDKLYYDIELPLISVLYDMEKTGFRVNREVLETLSKKLNTRLNELTSSIYEMTGKSFNINSPRQLSDVLFNNLNLPALKKNKTGFSLAGDVLLKMRKLHPVIDLVIEYRHISKLVSTYIEGLKSQISGDGRIHTVFKQANTSTGRLSSTEPNLQNIPIRDEEGREIRRIFIPSEGNILICADYSQIELRLLAHFSEDPKLVKAYIDGEDIHARTAAEIFKIDIASVSSDDRRKAKAVNFGIIYGISSFGLSENTNISRKAAQEYIDRYFETYPRVREYMDGNVLKAKETGKIRTITGRLRNIPEIHSSNFNVRSFGERASMNMPLQGSSADIIKIAMNGVFRELRQMNLKSKLILQIHDELVIDTVISEAELVKEIVREQMEGAVALRVPLIADISYGKDLYEAK